MDAKTAHHVHESPPSMTGVLAVLAALSAIGGFVALPHFLEPMLPLPEVPAELHPFETPLVVVSVVVALAGLAAAAFLFSHDGARAARLRPRFAALHRLLSGKYFIDELYDRAIGRPLHWISERVFLGIGDRRASRRLAARARRARAAHRRSARPHPDRQPAPLRASSCSSGSIACLVWIWACLTLPCSTSSCTCRCSASCCSRSCAQQDGFVRGLSLAVMVVQFLLAALLYVRFDGAVDGLQFETRLPWIPDWGVYYQIGLDGYNVLLVLLTAFLGPLVVAGAFTAIRKDVKLFYAMVFLIQFACSARSWPRISSCSISSGRRC